MYRLTDRNRSIGEMFSSIAPRYDFLNRLLSLGVDRRWRRLAVAETVPSTGGRFLDVATGTADMALELLRQKGAGATVAGVDLSVEMMRVGQEKCGRAGQSRRVAFLRAPGECLPFGDGVFDSVGTTGANCRKDFVYHAGTFRARMCLHDMLPSGEGLHNDQCHVFTVVAAP